MKDQVNGYLVYVVTLTWPLTAAITTIGKLSKPMVVADEYLGGSGVFLRGYSDLCRAGIPAVGGAATVFIVGASLKAESRSVVTVGPSGRSDCRDGGTSG